MALRPSEAQPSPVRLYVAPGDAAGGREHDREQHAPAWANLLPLTAWACACRCSLRFDSLPFIPPEPYNVIR